MVVRKLKRSATATSSAKATTSTADRRPASEPIGIVGAVAGLVVALRIEDFSTIADQVEREFAAVVDAAKKIDAFFKSLRGPVWIEDYGMSLAPVEIDGTALLNYCLP